MGQMNKAHTKAVTRTAVRRWFDRMHTNAPHKDKLSDCTRSLKSDLWLGASGS